MSKRKLKGGYDSAHLLEQHLMGAQKYIPEIVFDKLQVIVSKLVAEENLGGQKLNNLYNDQVKEIINQYMNLNVPKNNNEGFVIVNSNRNIKPKNNKELSNSVNKIFDMFEVKSIRLSELGEQNKENLIRRREARKEKLDKIKAAIKRENAIIRNQAEIAGEINFSSQLRQNNEENNLEKRFANDQKWLRNAIEQMKKKRGIKSLNPVRMPVISSESYVERTAQKAGKSRVRIKINPRHHALSDHGYTHVQNMPIDKRHRILRKVLKYLQGKYGERSGYRKLINQMNAAAVLLKNTDPKESKIFSIDRDWVSGLYDKFKAKI